MCVYQHKQILTSSVDNRYNYTYTNKQCLSNSSICETTDYRYCQLWGSGKMIELNSSNLCSEIGPSQL